MPRRRISLFALSLAALPMAAAAQEADVTGAQILTCEAERGGEGCATLLSRIFVCDRAPEMAGCAELMALRQAAVQLAESEAAMNDTALDEDIGIEAEVEAEEIEVEVRAEGELLDELEDEALTEGEEHRREQAGDDEADDGATAPSGVTPANDAQETTCPVLDSSDWAAWVNAMPGLEGPSLIVTGVVTLPTPGYSVTLEAGTSDRSMRPVQNVELSARPPAMDAPQVLSDYEVRFEMPSAAPINGNTAPFTAVRVNCAGQEIARIEPVEVAQ